MFAFDLREGAVRVRSVGPTLDNWTSLFLMTGHPGIRVSLNETPTATNGARLQPDRPFPARNLTQGPLVPGQALRFCEEVPDAQEISMRLIAYYEGGSNVTSSISARFAMFPTC